jgi:hypothetical protein
MILPKGSWILYALSYRYSNGKFKVLLKYNNNIIKNTINIKKINYNKEYINNKGIFTESNINNKTIIKSNLCSSEHFYLPDYHHFCYYIKYKPIMHRKIWEYFIINKNLEIHFNNKFYNKKGLGFAVGNEPLVPYFILKKNYITATDISKNNINYKKWFLTNQNIDIGFNKYINPKSEKYMLDEETFNSYCEKLYINMNNLPKKINNNKYDFLWSSCALEHLGSVKKSFDFIIKSLKFLKKGGIAVHTTEYNYISNDKTLITEDCIIFLKSHFKILGKKLKKFGYKLLPINFNRENTFINNNVDVYPYNTVKDCKLCNYILNDNKKTHINLNISGYNSTSIFFVIIK